MSSRSSTRSGGTRGSEETAVALVLADGDQERGLIAEAVRGNGYRVVMLTDPATTPGMLAAQRPKLVIVDAGVSARRPGVLQALKSLIGDETISVIVIGGAPGMPPLLGENAAEVHVSRPLTLEDLGEAVATAEWARPRRRPASGVHSPTARHSSTSSPEDEAPSKRPRKRKETGPSEARSTADYRATVPEDVVPKKRGPARRSRSKAAKTGGEEEVAEQRQDPRRKRFKSTLSFSASRVVAVATASHSMDAEAEAVDREIEEILSGDQPLAGATEQVPAPDAETQAWGKASGTINKRAAEVQRTRKRSDTFLRKHTVIAERYQVLGVLGSGGMATVYRVRDQELEEDVALKLLKTDKTDAASQHRFRQEMRICRRLQHPNIVRTFEFGVWEGRRFITMELLEGRDMAELLLMRRGAMPIESGLDLLAQAADGLRSAHRASVIHRDVKPHNLFVVRGTDVLKVMDFGIAKTDDSSLTVTSSAMVLGTPAYLAPERLKDKVELSAQTDLYSLGVVMYQVFTGALPFQAPDISSLLTSIVLEDPPTPRSVNPDLLSNVENLILRAMHKDPRHRYASCDQLLDDMKDVRTQLAG